MIQLFQEHDLAEPGSQVSFSCPGFKITFISGVARNKFYASSQLCRVERAGEAETGCS
jgi:hypothetical protein